MGRFFCTLLVFVSVLCASAQEGVFSLPFDFNILLSGNFAELRSNHFHAGIDFKTQGVVGKPIYAPADGYISRATVAAGGYGRAVYVTHDNGYITVYGHLERFPAGVADAVRKYQYDNETFAADLNFAPEEFPVKRGEQLAVAGNSGYSFGPHLHFEVRSSCGDSLLNPLAFYGRYVTDTRPPVAHAVAVTPKRGCGVVNGSASTVTHKISSGTVADTLAVWGSVGFSLKAEDFMNNTNNRYGLYSTELFVDDSLRFAARMDKYAIADTRQINAWADYERYCNRGEWFLRSYIIDNNTLDFLSADANRGWLTVDEERIYNIEYRLSDFHGNVTRCRFAVRGRCDSIPPAADDGHYLYWFLNNEIAYEGMRLFIPGGQLFENALLNIIECDSRNGHSRCYNLGGTAYPLRKKCRLSMQITDTLPLPPEKYHIVRKTKKGCASVGGAVDGNWVTADISILGCYEVAVDTVAPVVRPVNKKRWARSGVVAFSVKDVGTGMKNFKGLLDGKFVLFEYSSKNARLTCDLGREAVPRGTHKLLLTVTDCAGNETLIEETIKY